MACRMSLTGLSFFMNVIGIILNALGTFLKEWWIIPPDRKFGLMTVVTCEEYLCTLGSDSDSTDGWIVFVRVLAYAEFVLLIGALLIMAFGRVCRVTWLMMVSMAALALACLLSLVNTFTLISYYPKLTEAFQTTRQLPVGTLYFQTLPLGLIAISGTFCVPAFISLAIRQTKEKAGKDKLNAIV